MWLTMPEHIHSADLSAENLPTGPNYVGARRSPVAVGTFMLRRARYFNETGPEARRPDTAGAADGELQQAGHIRDPVVPAPGAKA